tara:strand:- start:3033 stop:3332 length:300 start_codon:yes stop_codon:yes gene_type:complete
MANLFFRGEKASKPEAESALRTHVAGACDYRFTVKFESDDGGNLINLYLEVENVSQQLPSFIVESLYQPIWMGWRYVITKCPVGYIDAILERDRSGDDY